MPLNIVRTPREVMEANHRRAEAAEPRPAPQVVNLEHARDLGHPPPLRYRGRLYPVRPIAFEDGLTMLELAARIADLVKDPGPDVFGEYRAALRETAAVCWAALRPRWYPRFLWHLRPNPLRRASLQELQAVLGFFGRCQTISHS